MSCPYLTEVVMVFCQASPVKKLIPTDRVSTASACDGESFVTCPLYREAFRRAQRTVEELQAEERKEAAATSPEAKKGATP